MTALPPPADSSHVDAFDRLRGVAIIAVLLHHFAVFTPVPGLAGRLYASFAEFSAHGVDLFFVLSGCLLVRQLAAKAPRADWHRGFWIRRLAKILPLYALLLVASVVVVPAALSLAGLTAQFATQSARTGEWPWHATFTTNWLMFKEGEFTNPLLNVAWSLAVEIQFYVLLSLAVAGGFARSSRFWLGLAGVAVLARATGLLLGWNWVQLLNFTPGRLDTFALGALVVLRPAWFSRPVRLLGATVLLAPLFLAWSREAAWVELVGYSWIALGAAVLVFRAAHIRPQASRTAARPAFSPLAFLGRISYSIYLTHVVIRAAFRQAFLPSERLLDHPSAWLLQLAYVVGTGAASILVGWLVWRWIERPAQTYVLSRLHRPSAAVLKPA